MNPPKITQSFFAEFDNQAPDDRLLVSKVKVITWCSIREAVLREQMETEKLKSFILGLIVGAILTLVSAYFL